MISLTLPAPAKINLTLDILGARPDGYHEMEMVMQSVSLCDTIRLDLGFAGGIRASSGLQFLPNDKDNLAVAAALAFRKATGQTWRDLLITIEKRIPVCAGLGGGSADAAAVLPKLKTLEEEDPLLRFVWDARLREIQVQLMGPVQIEVLESLIAERFSLAVKVGAGRILYRETIAAPVEGATMNILWNRMTPRKTFPMDALSTDAPPTSSAAMQNIPICECAL